jgi:hypothetical protein
MAPDYDAIIDEVVAHLDAENIPLQFIIKAIVTDFNGNQFELRGIELAKFLQTTYEAAEVRLVLDVRGIRAHMSAVIEFIYAD